MKNDNYYIQKILTDLRFIVNHMEGVSRQALEAEEVLLDSMLFRLIQIQETSKKLSDAYKMEHDEIPWTDISGLRNRIVHDYGNVDLGVVYATLTNDIPWLIEQFETE
ncbi:MAG: DUF86 domain-containing protein [Ruminococcaceae bacterium]|nr:DUF86 domain-containing protein [Oscillospiraceae bacterium]